MFFGPKKPKRLYYPVKSKWYTRPRRRKSSIKRSGNVLSESLKNITKKIPYLIATIGFVAVFLILLMFSSYFAIKNIQVVRENLTIDSSGIENKLNKYIGKNIFFFSKANIYETIQKEFPEFASITISKVPPSTLKIRLTSYPVVANLKAYYILPEKEKSTTDNSTELNKAVKDLLELSTTAKSEKSTTSTGSKIISGIFDLNTTKEAKKPKPIEQKSLLNSIGQAIFDREENLEFITMTIRNLDAPVKDRGQVIKKEHMDYLLAAIKYFNDTMKTEVIGAEYLSTAREIHLKTKKNLVVWIGLEHEYKTQIDKLYAIYEAAELNKENLSYIDLRVRDKLIYCQINTRCSTLSL